MKTRCKMIAGWGAVIVLVSGMAAIAVSFVRQLNEAADYSAHAALTDEICRKLAAIPSGQQYPDSLSRLGLNYPDGGSAGLLSRFAYDTSATSCIVRTVIHGREFVRSFP